MTGRAVLAKFASYYNQDRPHRSLGLETPVPSQRPVDGKLVTRPVLGGLHHVYVLTLALEAGASLASARRLRGRRVDPTPSLLSLHQNNA